MHKIKTTRKRSKQYFHANLIVAYDIDNDIVKGFDFHITGFSTLGKIYFNDKELDTGEQYAKDITSYYNAYQQYHLPQLEQYAHHITDLSSVTTDIDNNIKTPWNQITGYAENTLSFTSDSHAQFAGYQKK